MHSVLLLPKALQTAVMLVICPLLHMPGGTQQSQSS
jgi:hypothetical protein